VKDFFCVAVFVGKLLCLVVFVNALRPDSIGVTQASMRPAYCKTKRSRMQGCGLSVSVAASDVDVGTCSVRPTAAQC
jgi:hypothetical protein